MTRCPHDPRPLLGRPIGMYHCPNCGCMVIAGLPHVACEPECEQFDAADQAVWDRMMAQSMEDEKE